MAALEPAHLDALAEPARALLPRLSGRYWSDDVYLAGSAGLTLYLAHREVHALDLMSAGNRLAPPDRRDLLHDLLEIEPGTRVETARDGFLYTRTPAGVALRFFYYPYPLIDPESEVEGLPLASRVDLGLMKLGAVISRGTRKDFADLYLLARELPLEELLARSQEKFGHVRDFSVQALKGLTDFSMIDGGTMGQLREPLDWNEVESWFRGQARELARRRFGMPEER